MLGNVHYSRTLHDYPYLNDPGTDTMVSPPNRADLQNSSNIGKWVAIPMFNEQQVTHNKFPFASIPHWVQYVDPETGEVSKVAGIPVEQASSWEEGYQGSVTAAVVRTYEADAASLGRTQYFVIAHDGDNSSSRAGDGGTWANSGNVTYADGDVTGKGIDEYLKDHPIPDDDIVHVQDGSWIDTRDSSADPTWYHWHMPMGVWKGQITDFNKAQETSYDPDQMLGHNVSLEFGYNYLERNFALLQAALNYAKTAEQIWLDDNPNHWKAATALDYEITYPGNQLNPWMMSFPVKGDASNNYAGGANPAELAWYFLLPAMDSGFGYYDENVDDCVKPTIAFNQSLYFSVPYVDANAGKDRTGPSIWWPQRYPYNPGSANKGKSEGWSTLYADNEFAIYTYGYDVSDIADIAVIIRVHTGKRADARDKTFKLYDPVAHASDPDVDPARVGGWQTFPMIHRDLVPDINGVDWQSSKEIFQIVPAKKIGGMYYTYPDQFREQLLDYFIEATDSRGNVTRSEIQQVYVGAGRYENAAGKVVEDVNGTIQGTHSFFTDRAPAQQIILYVETSSPDVTGVTVQSRLPDGQWVSKTMDCRVGESAFFKTLLSYSGDFSGINVRYQEPGGNYIPSSQGALLDRGVYTLYCDGRQEEAKPDGISYKATIYYYSDNWPQVCLHYRPEGQEWTTVPGVNMSSEANSWWSHTVDLGDSDQMEFVTNDCHGSWDNNADANYFVNASIWNLLDGTITEGEPGRTPAPPDPFGTTSGNVFVPLFEWKWNDIAQECEDFLGPKGFDTVQVSPANEHIARDEWWARYQPVSYDLVSRSGTEAEAEDMVQRCADAGVKVYADMVINHTASYGGSGTGVGGTQWRLKDHPMYDPDNYHSDCTISNYNDAADVQNCGLSGLPDLDTASPYVSNTIADYFDKLAQIGVAGFRVDAAKHISPSDLQAILDKAGNPWTFLEVIGASGEAVQPDQYTHLAMVTEFKYGTDVAANFNGQIKNFKTLGESWGLLNSDKAIVFVDNHDRERGHGGGGNLTYKDGDKYNLANVFMLAYPYGHAKIHSGYRFDDTDAGPLEGKTNCSNSEWVCQHRWSNIANMVAFRDYTASEWSVTNWWDNGDNQIAFGRGGKGFVVINNDESARLNETLYTGLPAGEYCNILAGIDPCGGEIIFVDDNGNATFNVEAKKAAAIYGGAKRKGNRPPVAVITPGSEQVKEGAAVTFSAEDSSDSDGRIVSYLWNTGDTTPSISETFDREGTHTITLTVTDNEGATGTNSITITVVDETGFAGNFPALYFRGTPNTWTTTEMSLVSEHVWEAIVDFDGQANQRFKFDVHGDWSLNFGDNEGDGSLEQTGHDILTGVVGSYFIRVNDEDMTYELIRIRGDDEDYASNFPHLYFRGTPNNWEATEMLLAGDYVWQLEISFEGGPEQGFKFDVHGDWSYNFGDNDQNGSLEQNGANIHTTHVGSVIVEVDERAMTYRLIGEEEPCDEGPVRETLAPAYSPSETTFSIWSPESSNVEIWLDGELYPMIRAGRCNGYTGYTDVYHVSVDGDHKLKPYHFLINGESVRDPYGVMVEPNTNNNIVMDLSQTEPEGGWAPRPELTAREDAVIYEIHVRDFTIDDSSGVSPERRGKFLGMVETGATFQGVATGFDHLRELGVTHVQLLPIYDFASCLDVADQSCYNWGYDPRNFNVPEERYAVSQDYAERVREFKTMINEFHKAGIRVIMDVVYNHTYSKEMFDKITEQYYTETDLSGTGNSIDANVPMVSRMILDSLKYWAKEYHLDGFRFDLIGVFDYDEVQEWAIQLNNEFPEQNLLIYGEPWNGFATDPRELDRVRLGTIARISDAHVGVFNPKYREAIKGNNDDEGGGFAFNQGEIWRMRVGSRGAIRFINDPCQSIHTWDPMFAIDPEQSINYVSAHDNLCLRDKILAWADLNDRADDDSYLRRMHMFANGIVLTSQGIPMLHAGVELMRNKQGKHNTYKDTDDVNKIRWNWKVENADIFEYYKDVIELRKSHPGFRFNTWEEIDQNVTTTSPRYGVLINHIQALANDDTWSEVIVIYNSADNYEYPLPAGEWKVAIEKSDPTAGNGRTVSGSIIAEGSAVTVLYKKDTITNRVMRWFGGGD